MHSFWDSLKKPYLILAPMDNVTDVVFREIVAQSAPPDVFFTEFTATDGLVSKGKEQTAKRLLFTPQQRPIVAQIWGSNPEHFFTSAQMIAQLGFDGIDINMGCPDRQIVKRGSCGGLIANPTRALEIIDATKKGAPNLSLSVKTRVGFRSIDLSWIEALLDAKLHALTIHLRTVSEMSKVPAHWDLMKQIVRLRNQKTTWFTHLIGNGDIMSKKEAEEKAALFGIEGIMIGRGIFANPFVFSDKEFTQKDRIQLLIAHIQLFHDTWKGEKDVNILKKFYKMYVNGFPNAKETREQLMSLSSLDDTLEYLCILN